MRQIKAVIRYNFMGFYKKPKVILTFLLGFILCFLLSSRIMPVIQAYKSPVQMLEPFLWTFGDTTAILLSSVLLLLLFSDLPVLSAITPYYLCRTTKKRWLFGQLFLCGGRIWDLHGFYAGSHHDPLCKSGISGKYLEQYSGYAGLF